MAKKITLDDMWDDDVDAARTVVPLGLKLCDPALGGGLPEGVLAELFGPSGSGKTSAGYLHIAQQQKRGAISVLIDAERSWNPTMGARYGIDTKHEVKIKGKMERTFRMSSKPEMKIIEELFERIKIMLYNMPEVRFILVDSLAALSTRKATEKKPEDQTNTDAMDRARVLSFYMRELDRWIADTGNKCTVAFVNHEKEMIGMGGYGPPQTDTGGGKALKFYASFRLKFKLAKTEKVKVHDPVTGQDINKEDKLYIRMIAVKNRYFKPFVPATFVFDVGGGTGIDRVSTAMAHAIAQGVVTVALKEPEKGKDGKPKKAQPKKGYWAIPGEFSATGEPVEIHGKPKLKQYYEQNPEVFDRLEDHLAENLDKSSEVLVSPEDLEDDEGNLLDVSDLAADD